MSEEDKLRRQLTDLRRQFVHSRARETLGILIGIGLLLSFAGNIVRDLSPAWDAFLKGIGGSVLASVIVFALISLFLDPPQQLAQAAQISRDAIEAANRQFQERFELSLPSATFESSTVPKRDFQDAFVTLLSKSKHYDVKGGSGNFTTFRLFALNDRTEIQELKEIRLCLLDPRAENAIRAHARNQLAQKQLGLSDDAIKVAMIQLRAEILESIVTLFDIRDAKASSIYLHSDLPERWELFLAADTERRRQLFGEARDRKLNTSVGPLPGIASHTEPWLRGLARTYSPCGSGIAPSSVAGSSPTTGSWWYRGLTFGGYAADSSFT